MRVLVTGGTGLVGKKVCDALRAAGHGVTVVSREPGRVPGPSVGWDGVRGAVAESDAIVNLAGESVADGRWTEARKAEIRGSRIEATRALVRAVELATTRPKVLINASAIGYYGAHRDERLDETAGPGDDFLARVCRDWEAEAQKAEPLGLRVVRVRIGVVLAPNGGALASMLIPFRACLGGPIAGGGQWMSWVHRDDVVGLVVEALGNEAYTGAVNATAPNPVTNRDFAQALGRALGRPAVLPTPGFALRLALGEMASMLVNGQRVLPAVAERNGYAWRQPELAAALAACLAAA
jgi:uncharacterized protein (TIGR01777 family)